MIKPKNIIITVGPEKEDGTVEVRARLDLRITKVARINYESPINIIEHTSLEAFRAIWNYLYGDLQVDFNILRHHIMGYLTTDSLPHTYNMVNEFGDRLIPPLPWSDKIAEEKDMSLMSVRQIIDTLPYEVLYHLWQHYPYDIRFSPEVAEYWAERMMLLRNQPGGEELHKRLERSNRTP